MKAILLLCLIALISGTGLEVVSCLLKEPVIRDLYDEFAKCAKSIFNLNPDFSSIIFFLIKNIKDFIAVFNNCLQLNNTTNTV